MEGVGLASKLPLFEPFEASGLKPYARQLKLVCLVEPAARRAPATVALVKLMLDAAPLQDSPLDIWYSAHKDTLLADAAAHYGVALPEAGGDGAELTAEQLLEYYLALLAKHFESAQTVTLMQDFKRATQGTQAPSLFKDKLLGYRKQLEDQISTYEVADRFWEGLSPAVRDVLSRTLMSVPRQQWYARLNKTAEEADNVWNNLSAQQRMPAKEQSFPQASSSSAAQSKPAGRPQSYVRNTARSYNDQAPTFYCSRHGYNPTHDTSSCRVLHAQQEIKVRTAQVTQAGEGEGLVKMMKAFLSSQGYQVGPKQGASGSGANAGSGSGAGAGAHKSTDGRFFDRGRTPPRGPPHEVRRNYGPCTYCGEDWHSESRCYLKHPELAPPTFKPRTEAHAAMFERNKAEAIKRGKIAAISVKVTEDDYDEEDDHGRSAFLSKVTVRDAPRYSQSRRVRFDPTLGGKGLDDDSTLAPPPFCFGHSIMRNAYATVGAQAVPLSFEPRRVGSAYPPPAPPRMSSGSAEPERPSLSSEAGANVPSVPSAVTAVAQVPEKGDASSAFESYKHMSLSQLLQLLPRKPPDREPFNAGPGEASSTRATQGSVAAASESSSRTADAQEDAALSMASTPAPALAAVSARVEKVSHWRTPDGLPYTVSGILGEPPRTLAELDPHERGIAMKANPKGAAYLNRKVTLYYYPEHAASIRVPDGSLVSVASLRDKAADVNLMPAEVARSLNLKWKPTSTRLSTSLDVGHAVLGELEVEELAFVLLPDQPKTAYWMDNKLMMYTRMPYGLKNASAKFQRVMDYELGKANLSHYQPKTAYWMDNKLMMYTRMPYGLKNASAKFQRVMDYELGKANLSHCAVSFIDDVLIFSETPEEHVQHVAAVLDMLHSCGLRAHPDKSIFGADVIEYLGHNLSSQGISPHHAKVAAILALHPPRNVAELRSQLGFINYYRCYIPAMSQLVMDLNKLLKKDEPWVWGPDQQKAFDAVKAVFTKEGLPNDPLEIPPDPEPAYRSDRQKLLRRAANLIKSAKERKSRFVSICWFH
ncbi:hypothetical protein GPECTOR_476g406 [Gonium pectorale]|uniref:Reverse transcriptase domain-containing protein n=1 Tax=Gonium pectorale TaxID=33097 RepID=A0A150FUY8_GONPE|nr:hypothetical protein GPECTOR_476g406 [Gonium pectorale]|eukprot:KXZ41422.1 hypothetical protein GPECTOR_476g406 [Gonium pectorale]